MTQHVRRIKWSIGALLDMCIPKHYCLYNYPLFEEQMVGVYLCYVGPQSNVNRNHAFILHSVSMCEKCNFIEHVDGIFS